MEAEPDQTQQIIQRLAERTSGTGFKWTVSSAEPDEYMTNSSRFRYFIRSRDADGRAPYIFELYVPNSGREGPELVVDSSDTIAHGALQELYSKARRSALGFVEDLAVEVLRDLDGEVHG